MRPAKNFRKEHIYTSIYMQGSIFFPNPASYEFVTDIWYRQYFISLFYECRYTYAPLIPPPHPNEFLFDFTEYSMICEVNIVNNPFWKLNTSKRHHRCAIQTVPQTLIFISNVWFYHNEYIILRVGVEDLPSCHEKPVYFNTCKKKPHSKKQTSLLYLKILKYYWVFCLLIRLCLTWS